MLQKWNISTINQVDMAYKLMLGSIKIKANAQAKSANAHIAFLPTLTRETKN